MQPRSRIHSEIRKIPKNVLAKAVVRRFELDFLAMGLRRLAKLRQFWTNSRVLTISGHTRTKKGAGKGTSKSASPDERLSMKFLNLVLIQSVGMT